MSFDFATILYEEAFQSGIVIAAVVARGNGEIVYMTDNWSVEPSDIKQCISNWQKKAQFVKFQGIKYACLMNQPEYFSGVNYKDKAFLIGAATPDPEDQYYILGYAPPGSNGTNGYVDVTRAANRMRSGGSFMDANATMGKFSADDVANGAGGAIDPALKQEIDGFLQWIKDPEGLQGYIRYYIDQNDMNVIPHLSAAYNKFRQVSFWIS